MVQVLDQVPQRLKKFEQQLRQLRQRVAEEGPMNASILVVLKYLVVYLGYLQQLLEALLGFPEQMALLVLLQGLLRQVRAEFKGYKSAKRLANLQLKT